MARWKSHRRGPPYREPEPVGEILPNVLKGLRPKAGDPLRAVCERWPGVVGEATARRARPVALKDGELTVEVASAALRQHLAVFRRAEILKALSESGVNRLRCRVSGGL